MRIGYTIWYKDLRDLDYLVNELSKAEFDLIELSIDYPLCFKMGLPMETLRYFIKKGFSIGIHAPWRDIELASPISKIREASVEAIIHSIRLLNGIDVKYVVLHVTTEQAFCGYRDRECLDAAEQSLYTIIEIAKENDMDILVETTHDKCCGGEEQVPYLLERFPSLGLCVDIAHIATRRYRKWGATLDVEELFYDLPPIAIERTKVIHVHGFRELEYNITFTHLVPEPELISKLKNVLRRLENLEAIVLEVFKDAEGQDVRPSEIKWVVSLLRGV